MITKQLFFFIRNSEFRICLPITDSSPFAVRATPSLFVAFVDAPFCVSRIFYPELKLGATYILHLTAQVRFASHAVSIYFEKMTT